MHPAALRRQLLVCVVALLAALPPTPARGADADENPLGEPGTFPPEPQRDAPIERITVVGRRPTTATSTSAQTIPAEQFQYRPLESGGQMLEAVPNVLTAQHTGGGKAEQYFIRGFDADHGTDLKVLFDGVPVNLRSHAHGQGFLDLHFVTPETIDRLEAYKGPYFARYGDFATAGTVEYVPADSFPESMLQVGYGSFETFRAVGILSPRSGPFAEAGPARGYLSFEAYHTNGPFENSEKLWRYSAFAKGEVDLGPDLTLSGHLLGYYADWNASGLVPRMRVDDGRLDRFGSLDPSEGGDTTRVQAKIQADWVPVENGHLTANAYVSYYDFTLYSNFTYYLVFDSPRGDGIVQKDRGRIYAGGRIEYDQTWQAPFYLELRGGLETRFDDARVLLGNQTRRKPTDTISDDDLSVFSLEPYFDVDLDPFPWLSAQLGLRLAWFHFDGRDRIVGEDYRAEDAVRWLPKANVNLAPFSAEGPLPVDLDGIRDLQLYLNFGVGYHSNDARTIFEGGTADPLTRAIGGEVGITTRVFDRVDLAVDWWLLQLEDELRFVGDEGTTESVGETLRLGVEFAATIWLSDWWYLRGDVAYTSVRLVEEDVPLAQAPRFVTKAATGVRFRGLSAEFNVRHLGERYATEDAPGLKLSGYTVLDFAARYRLDIASLGFLELGFAIENIADTKWASSEFYYESRPIQGGEASEDFHFSPGNPRNFRGWITAYF